MATMQWDGQLAKLAELRVLSCKMEEKDCHNTKNSPSSGQNVQVQPNVNGTNEILLFSIALNEWYNVSKFTDPETMKFYSSESQA
uniref:SCP domain-containing protein n=1 Tax=Glossina morsitans morsitans TaxID=37546 RepID=A0A1B0FJK5_GLOMM